MMQVTLTKGYVTTVDDGDYDRVMAAGPWRAIERRRKDGSLWNVYAQRTLRTDGVVGLQKLHRFILGITDPDIKVDHEHHDGLNNTRKNLRVSTQSQNSSNRQKMQATSSRFKGVSWFKPYSKWRVQIEIAGKKKHLGYFLDEVDAARAYNAKAKEIFKEFALVNDVEET
jgi:hypothetical protein